MALLTPAWLGATTTSVVADRAALATAYTPNTLANDARGGLLWGPNNPGNVTSGSGTVSIAAFRGVVMGTVNAAANQGSYIVTNDATVTLSATPSSSSLFRRDRVVVEVLDTENGGASNGGTIRLVPGTPNAVSGSATLPAMPANSLELAQILVAGNGSITITDTRVWTSVRGERLRCTSTTRPANPYLDLVAFETDTQREIQWSGTEWVKTGGPPQLIYGNGNQGSSGNIGAGGSAFVTSFTVTSPIAANTGRVDAAVNVSMASGTSSIGSIEVTCNGITQTRVYSIASAGMVTTFGFNIYMTLTQSYTVRIFNNAGGDVAMGYSAAFVYI